MRSNIIFNKENLYIIFLFLFSLLINQYYGNRGIFPVDSFAHFDTGFRILLGEYPFRDYWVISGPLIDYIQALFFYFFGVNWQSYVLHASLFNAVLTITTFFVLRNFQLNIFYSFIYSIFFSILAYTSTGTPFVDHHSGFFSLLGIYFLILAIKNEKNVYWALFPIFFGLAFFSKQTPASYIIIGAIIVLTTFSLTKKNFRWLKYSSASIILFILFLLLFGKLQGIRLSSFLEQYIYYPQTIGEQRFQNFEFSFRGVIGHFKFIYLSFMPLLYVNLKNLFFTKKYFGEKDFYYFLFLLVLTLSLIFHQLLTRNQTFIFFLIPILLAFSHISLKIYKLNLTSPVYLIIILFCLFATTKYHFRFNEGRKFHELNYVDFNLSINGEQIDKRLVGLNWITPEFGKNPDKEITLINDAKFYLKKDNRNKMLMTNYSLFSSILDQKLYSPTRWHLPDGTDYPLKESNYFASYKNLLVNIIKKNDISVIYTFHLQADSVIYTYFDKSCFDEIKINELFNSYELGTCNEING